MSDPAPEAHDPTCTGHLAAAGLKAGDVLARRYRIERLLGIGGMGMVYAATDLELDIGIAVKLLRPELALRPAAFERIRQELLIARQVSSPHVVRIHDLARDGERAFITMDLIDGEALDRRLERLGMLPIDSAIALALQVAEGLQAAHACNVVHRDLKPSNVLVDGKGRALIADFGVARSLATAGSLRSHSGAIVGTPEYLSPEQARGLEVDGRSDLYALGLLLFEMLTGRLPFDAATPAEAISQRLLAVPRPLRQFRPEAPLWLEQLLARLLRSNAAHRLGPAAVVIAALRDRRLARDSATWRRRAAWAGFLLTLTGAGAAWWWWQDRRPPVAAAAIAAPAARLLVLADAAGDAGARDVLDGHAAVLRRLLEAQVRWPVIDAERGLQAVAQLSLPEGAAPDAATLWSQLPGAHILRLRPGSGAGAGVRLEWQAPDSTAPRTLVEHAHGAQLLAAAHQALAVDSGRAPWPQSWPTDLDTVALGHYGQSVRAAASGDLPQAAALLDATLAGRSEGSGRALLALERAQIAVRTGDSGMADRLLDAVQPVLPSAWNVVAADLRVQLGQADAQTRQILAERAGNSGDDLWSALALARADGEQGELERALTQLEALCARDPGDPRAWFLRGKYSILRGDARAAVDEFLVRALVLYKRARNSYGEAETVNALGVAYARLGQLDEAADQYARAVDLRRQVGNRRGEASTLRNLAQLATVRGQASLAARLLAQARTLFEALEDAAGQAAVDNELGLLAEERGDFAAAQQSYRRSLRARQDLGHAGEVAESLNNLGFAHFQLGDYDSAQVYWRQAAASYEKLDDLSGRVRTAQNLGLLETARGHFAKARGHLEQSLALAEQQQMAEEAAVSQRNLAELALLQGRLRDSRSHLERARRLFEERGDQRGLVDATLLEVQLLQASGLASAARTKLAALEPTDDQEASLEQRALAALLGAGLAITPAQERAAAGQALRLAERCGVRVVLLAARLLATDAADGGLDREIEILGNAVLRMRWQERQLEMALAAGQVAAAVALYGRLRQQLAESTPYGRAWAVHAAGVRALQAAGQDDSEARAAARASAQALLEELPAAADVHWRQVLEAQARG